MEFTFILVEPGVPGNVGASARALKTMGFNRLALVNSLVHLEQEAIWLAHGSNDILEGIVVYDTLDEAVKGMDLVIGTTAKKRRVHADYYYCSEIPALLEKKSPAASNVAIVFGREESGLTNQELKLCHIFTGIPMHDSYPSLNLSQSVMIYAWELSAMANNRERSLTKMPGRNKLIHLREMVEQLLTRIGYDRNGSVFSRIMERVEVANDKDAGLIMSVCSKIDELLRDKEQG